MVALGLTSFDLIVVFKQTDLRSAPWSVFLWRVGKCTVHSIYLICASLATITWFKNNVKKEIWLTYLICILQWVVSGALEIFVNAIRTYKTIAFANFTF